MTKKEVDIRDAQHLVGALIDAYPDRDIILILGPTSDEVGISMYNAPPEVIAPTLFQAQRVLFEQLNGTIETICEEIPKPQ